MKKGLLGIILSSVGILSLIYITFDFMTGGASSKNVTSLFLCSIAGAAMFFVGLGLVGKPVTAEEKSVDRQA